MKTLTDFRKTVETGVDPRLVIIINNRSRRHFEHLPQWEIWPHEWDF